MTKPTILLADDDRDILETNKFLLSDEFDVEIASNVEDAKLIIRANNFDAAIIDLNFEGQALDRFYIADHGKEGLKGLFGPSMNGLSDKDIVLIGELEPNTISFFKKTFDSK